MMDCFGFTALIVIAILFFGVISSLRRRQRERMERIMYRQYAAPPPPPTVLTTMATGVCPRCNAVNAPEASFCRQCGLNVRPLMPPAAPPRRNDYRRTSPALLYLIFALIGVIGLAALFFSRSRPSKWDDDDGHRGPRSHKEYRYDD